MQVLISGEGNGKSLVINGKKLLEKLGLDENNLTSEMVAEKLLQLTNEEREALFFECSVCSRIDLLKMLDAEVEIVSPFPILDEKILKFNQEELFLPYEDYFERTPEVIKKELKYEKNPMRIRQLNQELTAAYKSLKGRW